MNRDEAIAIIRKEYLCVDRDCDIDRSCGKCDLMMPSKEPILEAYKMAIKALEQEPKTDSWSIKDVADTFKKHGLIREQEPCEDAIDRAEAIKIASGYCHPANVAKELAKLPSVTPQTKTGNWIRVTDKTGHLVWECDKCGWQQRFNTNFCPDCGSHNEGD